jgi:hypothetical protein
MHGMLKSAAASAIPALLGLAVFPVHPDGTAQLARFYRVGSPIGGAATGIIGSKGDKITGNRVTALGGTGLDNSTGGSTGFSEVVDGATISGISLGRGQGNAIAGKRG